MKNSQIFARHFTSLMLAGSALAWGALAQGQPELEVEYERVTDVTLPAVPREFRGVWVASVANIDWPSKKGLSTAEQKAEMRAILDRCQAIGLNAVVLQIRPTADALYRSRIEPWSVYLTGKQGQAPDPGYDPLAEWVKEAHLRGLELHAWFNPFRAGHSSDTSEPHKSHVRARRPDLVRQYGNMIWMDPSEPDAQRQSMRVVLDVVRRYDIDGVHVDDYFYPYPDEKAGEFPDDAQYQKYLKKGGKLAKDDWRRDNINKFMKKFHDEVKKIKPHVKVGVSPFGIWRPGYPQGIEGFDQYAKLYADAKLWWNEGWMDYLAPQLYWNIDREKQSFEKLMNWWASENTQGRHLWPGLFTSKYAAASKPDEKPVPWPADEIQKQIKLTRDSANQAGSGQGGAGGATGVVHFSMKALMDNMGGLAGRLESDEYAGAALVPPSPWLDDKAPKTPFAKARWEENTARVEFRPALFSEEVRRFVVYARYGQTWRVYVTGAARKVMYVGQYEGQDADVIAVTAIDKTGNESKPFILKREVEPKD